MISVSISHDVMVCFYSPMCVCVGCTGLYMVGLDIASDLPCQGTLFVAAQRQSLTPLPLMAEPNPSPGPTVKRSSCTLRMPPEGEISGECSGCPPR